MSLTARWLRVSLATGLAFSLVQCTGDSRLTEVRPGLAATSGGEEPIPSEILVGAGNLARCDDSQDEATALLLDAIPGTVFADGDNVRVNGSLSDYQDCYGPSWGRHKARTRPVPGEIEYKTAGAAGYFNYFGAAAGDTTQGYYSYNLGAWHVIVLNTNIAMTAGSAQEQWLRTDLTANTKQCTVAYLHHPRFSSYGTGVRSDLEPLWTALYDFGADIVVSAHYRVYERFAPQTPDEVADSQGLRQFTVGTGGHGVDRFGASHRVNSVVRADNVYGVLKLSLADGSYTWDFVPIAGQTFTDTGSGTCHTRVLVASVAVSPATASVLLDQSVQLTATPLDTEGNPLPGRVVAWSSGDPAVASVDSTGLVTGVAAGGPITITATSDGRSGTATITVTTVPVATVDVSPAAATIEAGGDTVRLTAVAKDADGNVLPGRVATWASSDPEMHPVDADGVVTGVAPGEAEISAIIEGQSDTAAVTVVPAAVASVEVTPGTATLEAGTEMVFTATLRDARGNALTGRVIDWASSDPAIAAVPDADDGDVVGMATGTVTITATSEGKTGSATLTVTSAPVASVDVTPTTASVVIGATVQFTATPKSANGTPLPDRPVTWTTNDPAVATVDAAGLVTGVGAGTATISASSEGKTGTASVQVAVVPVASVDVSPPTAAVVVGGSVRLTATARDSAGNPLTGRAAVWTRSAPAIGWVDSTGLVLGLSPGDVTITASVEGHSGTSVVTVTPLPPGSPVVFVGAGDIGSCPLPGDEATADVLDRTPGTVFLAGDDAYEDGTFDEFMNCYDPTWGRHKSRTRPAPGNHEYQTPDGAGYYAYFGAAAGDPAKGYYSYELGDWHIIVLNPEIDAVAGSPQEQWLRADLAASDKQCTLAVWHEPIFSSSARAGTGYAVGQAFYQALYEAYADVVINGHDHTYERFAPQSPTGVLDDVQGIREFVVGTGGASLNGASGTPLPNSEARNGQAWGVLKLTLRAGSYDWEFLPGTGQVYSDVGSGVCHSAPVVPNQPPTARPGGPYAAEGAIAFDGSTSSDPDNHLPLTYAWDFGDGGAATGATPTHSYALDGTYTVTLTVTDSKGLSGDPATTTATVGNIAPTVGAGPDISALTGGAFTVNASFSDPGADDAPWGTEFNWGDGTTTTGSTNAQGTISATHAYTDAGQYTLRVTVTDKDGGAGVDEALVDVTASSTPQVFIGAGNIAACSDDRDELTAQIIDANPGSTVFALGDNAYPNGTLADYSNCYGPTWGRHKSRTHPTPGNREYVNGSLGAGYFDYWGAAAGERNKGWYSYDLGDWHIVVLNDLVAFGAGSEQEAWLRADLAASTKLCTLAYWHNPRFFSSTSAGWTSSEARKILWDDLYAGGAEIVLNGQQHQYERLAPMRPDGTRDDATGIREWSVGTGGESAGLPTAIHPNSETISAAFGVLKLVLGPGSYSWEFIGIPGSTYSDSGSGSCH